MNTVLISTRPKWCEKITNREKPIEVRKSAPKEVPFKALIYETKKQVLKTQNGLLLNPLAGKVIGEFICDKIEEFTIGSLHCDDIQKQACLSYKEIVAYFYKPNELNGKNVKRGYAWHISNLKIYDKPKELSEFKNLKGEPIKRAPQSWQYVQEVEE